MRQLRASATLSAFMALAGCATAPRLPPPPELIGSAVPEGFGPEVRLVTTDKTTFDARAARLFSRVGEAATDGTIDYLVLSGGGSGGSFGAGAMVGLSRAHHRPQFEVVTGVSAGALIAPFAYLGPSWDPVLTSAFTGGDGLELIHSKKLAVLKRLLLPRGRPGSSTLFKLVDRFVTPAMIQAVTREYAKGRLLFIATTDLDKQETVLWNLGAIATHGGEQARRLFRDVLIASASVPGVFPPVLIPVEEDGRHYQEMHVDGGVTTSLFAAPLTAQLFSQPSATLPNANLYVVIERQTRVGSPADSGQHHRHTGACVLGGLHLQVTRCASAGRNVFAQPTHAPASDRNSTGLSLRKLRRLPSREHAAAVRFRR